MISSSISIFNNLTSGILTRSRSGFSQIIHYRSIRKQKQQLQQKSLDKTSKKSPSKAWRTLRRCANNIWFQLGGGGKHLNSRIVKEIWRLHVGSSEDYFVKVIHNACKRDTDLAQQLLNGRHFQNIEPKELVITRLAENLYAFFDRIMSEEILTSQRQIRELSYDLGRRHAPYSIEQYNLTYWDTINLSMMEELENTGLFDEIDLKAWQRLISMINDSMFMGYLRERESLIGENRELIIKIDNDIDGIGHKNCMKRSWTCE